MIAYAAVLETLLRIRTIRQSLCVGAFGKSRRASANVEQASSHGDRCAGFSSINPVASIGDDGFVHVAGRKAHDLPDKLSIPVLPFTNVRDDASQHDTSDGMTEGIIEFSRFSELFVTARNSSFTSRGRAVDVHQLGCELGVLYVLEDYTRGVNLLTLFHNSMSTSFISKQQQGDLDGRLSKFAGF